MITWNSLPDIFKSNVSFSMFKGRVQNFYLEKYFKILMPAAIMIAFSSDIHASAVFQIVIVFGFEYCNVKFPIIYFLVIIRIMWNVIVVGYVFVSKTIIVRLFQCN